MFRFMSAAAACAAVVLAALPSSHSTALADSRMGKPLGVALTRDHAASRLTRSTGPLIYNGGPVQTSTHHTYAIYWGPTYNAGYKNIINGYFHNVAAASGAITNVYSSDIQYYQTVGGSHANITYSESFDGVWSDASRPGVNGCRSKAGGNICVTDKQVQHEVTKAINANGWPTGMHTEYFVFLSNGFSTCDDSTSQSCAFSDYCAYHSNFYIGGQPVLYANMPYTGHNLNNCGSGRSPNGNAAADSTLNVTSHEANETITDPLGNAWYDRIGNENGDKCAWVFKTSNNYNQTINGARYYLQSEWSNLTGGCVLSG